MGKKAKEHRKKVAARNQKIKAEQKKMQKVYQEMFNTFNFILCKVFLEIFPYYLYSWVFKL